MMSRLRALWCWLAHFPSHVYEPWGNHRYYAHCKKCGREWDQWE